MGVLRKKLLGTPIMLRCVCCGARLVVYRVCGVCAAPLCGLCVCRCEQRGMRHE